MRSIALAFLLSSAGLVGCASQTATGGSPGPLAPNAAPVAANDPAAFQNGVHQCVRLRTGIGIYEPPLPTAAEPQSFRFLEQVEKLLRLYFLQFALRHHLHIPGSG